MKNSMRNNIFLLLTVVVLIMCLELMSTWQSLVLFILGAVVTGIYFFYNKIQHNRLVLLFGVFCMTLALLLTKSIWLLLLCVVLLFQVFHTEEGNEFMHLGEALLHPFKKQTYHGIQLIEKQSGQRTLLKKQSFFDKESSKDKFYEWDDINLVFLGGDSIVDLGNTILPNGESIVCLRKVFGRTRIIIPREVGLKLNISAISAKVAFESQTYSLMSENFRWESPEYHQSNRSIRLIISVVSGDIEVIFV